MIQSPSPNNYASTLQPLNPLSYLSLMPACPTHPHSLGQTILPTLSVNTALYTPRTFSFQAAAEGGETQAEPASLQESGRRCWVS